MQKTYAKELLMKLSKAREYMAAITKELRHKQKEYYDLGRKTTQFLVGDLVVVRRTQRSGQTGIAGELMATPMDWPVSNCRTNARW